MYNEISEIRPYFFSIREFSSTEVSLDVKLPLLWDISLDVTEHPNMRFKEQDRNEVTKLISFVNQKTEYGYKELFKCVKGMITFNLEKERKGRLLEEKINELKKLFKEKDLSTLENLNFGQVYEERIGTGDVQIGHTSGEESEGDSKSQEETD